MEKHIVKVLDTFFVTHDVKAFRVNKPEGYSFRSGQATEVSINKPGLEDKRSPFTFTSMPTDEHLEFTIKIYPSHDGVTNELLNVKKDDELILHDVFGEIAYKGPGVFIAGGAGITPFISILRMLKKESKLKGHTLIFANKMKKDVILEEELRSYLGDAFINILDLEKAEGYEYGRITGKFLKEHVPNFANYFYVCGPPSMIDAVLVFLSELGVPEDKIVIEGD